MRSYFVHEENYLYLCDVNHKYLDKEFQLETFKETID